MYVCICRQVTDTQIREAIADGATTMRQLCKKLPIGTQCGRCCMTAKEILQEHSVSSCSDFSNDSLIPVL
jgi:bacterioferritin-associated ferredoxin